MQVEKEMGFLMKERAAVGRQKKEYDQKNAIHAQRVANDR